VEFCEDSAGGREVVSTDSGQNAMFDIWLMLGLGVPLAPFTLALVLGNRAEDAFRLSMIGSCGDLKVFWSNGLVGLDYDAGHPAAFLAGDRRPSRPRRMDAAGETRVALGLFIYDIEIKRIIGWRYPGPEAADGGIVSECCCRGTALGRAAAYILIIKSCGGIP
jgi:hypothetical protein